MDEKYDYEGIPAHIDGDHCSAWLDGYNAAVCKANIIIEAKQRTISDLTWQIYPEPGY